MYNNELRTVTVDVDALEALIGNTYFVRTTKYCDLEAYMEIVSGCIRKTTITDLAKRWKWSDGRVRRFLNRMTEYGLIKVEKLMAPRCYYSITAIKPEVRNGK